MPPTSIELGGSHIVIDPELVDPLELPAPALPPPPPEALPPEDDVDALLPPEPLVISSPPAPPVPGVVGVLLQAERNNIVAMGVRGGRE